MDLATACLRCGASSDDDDLVCVRCSETRVRTVPPQQFVEDFNEDDVALFGTLVYDEQLERAERESAGRVAQLMVQIRQHLGVDLSLVASASLVPRGDATRHAEVEEKIVHFATVPFATIDGIRDRVAWARQTTMARGLRPLIIDERRFLARRGFRGDADGLPLLLAARLRLALLSLGEANEKATLVSYVQKEGDLETLFCEAHILAPDKREKPIAIELFSLDGSPTVDLRFVVAAAEFCELKLWKDSRSSATMSGNGR